MPSEMTLTLWALVILQSKHFLADFVLAPRYGLREGERYFLAGRLIYALLHAAGSFPAILLLGGWRNALIASAVEFAFVFNLTFGASQASARGTPSARERTGLLGAEQLLHQLFYLALLAAI
jgi:hypothetical protein